MPNPPLPLPEEPGKPDDAALLWRDDPKTNQPTKTPASIRDVPGASYDLIEPKPGEAPSPGRSGPPPAEEDLSSRGSRREQDETAGDVVDMIYTRWAEWRPAIFRLVGLALGTLTLAYFSLDLGSFEITAAILLGGMLAGVVLSYPILVTLERPVRFTPEQAVRDYYGSLSHHVPQVRRMWLLLSRGGRQSSRFASLEGFQRYWETRLSELRGNAISAWTPLVFEVIEYDAEKSAERDALTARFSVRISARGQRSDGPLTTIPVKARLLRGPDRQWYLCDGMLPEIAPKS